MVIIYGGNWILNTFIQRTEVIKKHKFSEKYLAEKSKEANLQPVAIILFSRFLYHHCVSFICSYGPVQTALQGEEQHITVENIINIQDFNLTETYSLVNKIAYS